MATNLVTKAEYKAYMGITSSNSDVEVDFLIPKVSDLVKTYCRRTFIDYYDEAKTEYFDGGFKQLILKETPVVNVVSLGYSEDFGKTYRPLTKFTDWIVRDDYVLSTSASGFPEVLNGYKVTYFAGYDVVPSDLKLAVLDLVEYYSRNNGAVHSTRDLNPNTTQISYVATSNFPAHIKRVLDQYMSDFT
jgi:hypothetical protein